MLKSILEYARDYGDKKWHQSTFQYIRYAVYIVTAIAFTGVVTIDSKYIYILETIIEVYVAIFLMLKFNPLIEHKKSLSAFDRQIAWTAGVFLFYIYRRCRNQNLYGIQVREGQDRSYCLLLLVFFLPFLCLRFLIVPCFFLLSIL